MSLGIVLNVLDLVEAAQDWKEDLVNTIDRIF